MCGKLSARYESKGDPGIISSGSGDPGGKSYGAYQFSGRWEVPTLYMNWLKDNNYTSLYNTLATGYKNDNNTYGKNFDEAWLQLADTNYEEFLLTQHLFTQKTYYQETVDKVKARSGVDLSQRGYTLQNVIWSRGVQHNASPAANLIIEAMSTLDMTTATDEALIRAIYAESGALKTDINPNGYTMSGATAEQYGISGKQLRYFSGSSSGNQVSIWVRLNVTELNDALEMYKLYG